MKKIAVATFALAMAASMALAGTLNQFKAGDISFSLLDKDGATPLQAASIKAIDSASGAVAAEVVSDELGQAVLALDAGRYVLNVSDLNLAVFDVDAAEGISLCRVIMPDTALLVGGQDAGSEEDDDEAIGEWVWPVVLGAGAVALFVGAGFIIDNNTGGHHHHHADDATTPVVVPTVKKVTRDSKNPSAI